MKKSEQKSLLAKALLNVICISLVLLSVYKPNGGMVVSKDGKVVAPEVSSLQMLPPVLPQAESKNINYPKFAFAPGWSSSKLREVNISGVDYLSFYDIPVNADGTLNSYTDGYQLFNSGLNADLIQKSKNQGTKVLVTLTQAESGDIESFLNNPNRWQTTIDQSINEVLSANINGVTIDFEYNGVHQSGLKNKFNQFVDKFVTNFHSKVPNSIVAVSVPSNSNHFYDVAHLSKVSDRVFMMAYDFAVPENNGSKNQRDTNNV